MAVPYIELRVYGVPGPQGSKKLVGRDGKGRGILVESSKKVKPWREAVKYAAREAMDANGMYTSGPISGGLSVEMTFTLPKPKSAPKTRVTLPDRKPDLSKLVRSTEDALTDSGIWEDDARVVCLLARKVFPLEAEDSLDSPGVVIRIAQLIQSHAPSKQMSIHEGEAAGS